MKASMTAAVLVLSSGLGCAHHIYDVKLDRSLFLDTKAGQKVWVGVTNTSSLQNFPLAESIRPALKAKGYTLVKARDRADVVLRVNVRYSGLMEEAMKADKIAGGAAAGGIVGGLTTAAAGGNRSGTAASTLGGMLLGAGLGAWLDKHERQNTFVTIVDFQITERHPNKTGAASIYARIRERNLTMQTAADRVRRDIAAQIVGLF